MLKKMFLGAMAGVMLFSTTAFANNTANGDEIKVNVNGQRVEFENQEPVIIEGRTLIPLRGVFEKLGYSASWEANTKTATLSNGVNNVVVVTGSNEIKVNDKIIYSEVPAQIINSSLLIPLRAIAEGVGGDVEWNAETKTADINALSEDELEEIKLYNEQMDKCFHNYIEKQYNTTVEGVDGLDILHQINSIIAEDLVQPSVEYVLDIINEENKEEHIDYLEKIAEIDKEYVEEVSKIEAPKRFKEFHESFIGHLGKSKSNTECLVECVKGEITKEEAIDKIKNNINDIVDYTDNIEENYPETKLLFY